MKSDVFYLRSISPAIRLEDLPTMAEHAQGCFGLHHVEWRMSFLSENGSEMFCWYRAPDAESVRIALRALGANMCGVWPGRLESPPNRSSSDSLMETSVLVVVPVSDSQELGEQLAKDIKSRGGELISRIISLDGLRSVWLFQAVDVGCVAEAFNSHGLRNVRAWHCRVFSPDCDSPPELNLRAK
jgi:hypothetical protein